MVHPIQYMEMIPGYLHNNDNFITNITINDVQESPHIRIMVQYMFEE